MINIDKLGRETYIVDESTINRKICHLYLDEKAPLYGKPCPCNICMQILDIRNNRHEYKYADSIASQKERASLLAEKSFELKGTLT